MMQQQKKRSLSPMRNRHAKPFDLLLDIRSVHLHFCFVFFYESRYLTLVTDEFTTSKLSILTFLTKGQSNLTFLAEWSIDQKCEQESS